MGQNQRWRVCFVQFVHFRPIRTRDEVCCLPLLLVLFAVGIFVDIAMSELPVNITSRRYVLYDCWQCWLCRVVVRMAKFDREAMKKTRLQMTTLKSTGQSKFALEDEVKTNIFVYCLMVNLVNFIPYIWLSVKLNVGNNKRFVSSFQQIMINSFIG